MKILIVNAYFSNKAQFAVFEKIVKQVFTAQRELIDTEAEFFVCDASNIDEYLYEMGSNHTSVNAARLFDFIDLVLIEGDCNLRPWSQKARKFVGLIKNCIKSQKIVYCGAFAMQALVYLTASNQEKYLNLVNSTTEGGFVEELKTISERVDLNSLTHYDCFLDRVTGDMYSWEEGMRMWRAVCNVGLHCRKAAQEHTIPGKFMLAPDVHRVSTLHAAIQPIYEGKKNETVCYLRKVYINHYALRGLEQQQFLIPCKHSWDLHQVKFPSKELTYSVLAETRFCAQLIEVNESTLGAMFQVSPKYPETVAILRNFVLHHLARIKDGNRSVPIKEAQFRTLGGALNTQAEVNRIMQEQRKRGEAVPGTAAIADASQACVRIDSAFHTPGNYQQGGSLASQQIPDTTVLRSPAQQSQTNLPREGSARILSVPPPSASQGRFVFVADTDLQQRATLPSRPDTAFTVARSLRPATAMTQKTIKSISEIRERRFINEEGGHVRAYSGTGNRNQLSFEQQYQQLYSKYRELKAAKQLEEEDIQSAGGLRSSQSAAQIDFKSGTLSQPSLVEEPFIQPSNKRILKNKAEIRQLLHPQLTKDGLPEQPTVWIPGHQSVKNLALSSNWQEQLHPTSAKAVRVPSATGPRFFTSNLKKDLILQEKIAKTTIQTRPSTAQKLFHFKADYDECREHPIVRCSSPFNYEKQLERERLKAEDSRILANRIIKTGLLPKPYQTGLGNVAPYENKHAETHTFRDQQKKKWLAKHNFRLVV